MIDAMGMPQTAVVVGGTSDIARAVLRALVARRLRRVVLLGRDEIGTGGGGQRAPGAGDRRGRHRDVRRHRRGAARHRRRATASARLGQVDLVLVAAGMLGNQARDEADPEAVARVLTTNFTGTAAIMTAFASVLRHQGHGRMVVLSSVAGVRVRRANYVYGASKAGLDGFAARDGRGAAGLGGVAHDRPPRLGGHPDDRGARPRTLRHHARGRGGRRGGGHGAVDAGRVVTAPVALGVRGHATVARRTVAAAPGLSPTPIVNCGVGR